MCLWTDDDHRAEANSEEQAGVVSDRGYCGDHASHDQGMLSSHFYALNSDWFR